MMMSVPLLFLVTALSAKRVSSLECYICNTTEYVGCKTTGNCSATEPFCTKFTATTKSGFLITQSCASVCPIARNRWPPLYTFMCCQADRCNRASGTGSGRTLLVMATSLVSTIRASALLGF